MKFQIDTFDNNFSYSREIEGELLNSGSPFVSAFRSYHEFFVGHVFTEINSMSPVHELFVLDLHLLED